jgi:hypothetical protein
MCITMCLKTEDNLIDKELKSFTMALENASIVNLTKVIYSANFKISKFHRTDNVDCLLDKYSCAYSSAFFSFSDNVLPIISLNCRALITAAPP